MNTFLYDICVLLDKQESFVLATITEHSGSTPRGNGAQMAILHNGSILGTVGGGLLEARCMLVGTQLLQKDLGASALCRFHLDNEEAAKAAMVCGGSLTVILEHIGQQAKDSVSVNGAAHIAATAAQCLQSLKALGQDGSSHSMTSRYIWDHELSLDGAMPSEKACNPSDIENIEAIASRYHIQGMKAIGHTIDILEVQDNTDPVTMILSDEACTCTIRFSQKPQLILFGAGHVAQPTAQLGLMMGFAVTVVDDRDEFANENRFPNCRVLVCPSYDKAFNGININDQSYIAIMTRGHLHDGTVLQQALKTSARYIGMIGSSRKRDALYAELRKDGVSDEAIARCHCPIGLTIKAQSPEEIAVSIMAELILCRAS